MNQTQEIEIKSQNFKFHIFIIISGFLFLILLLRLFSLQIYQGEKLRDFSDNNRFKKQLLIAPRGLIFDREGKILAGNKKTTQLIIQVNLSSSLDQILKKISKIIQKPVKELKTTIETSKKRNTLLHPVILKEVLSVMEIHQLNLLQWNHKEIQVREINKRIYPLKENGSQVIGFIGSISKKELQKLKKQKRYSHPSDIVGKSGLEKLYNNYLKGQNGFSMVEVNARYRISKLQSDLPFDFVNIPPVKGEDLTLTIDKDLQNFALKAMRREDSIGPRKGAVLVMKTNGEILTMLSEPGFDPNIFSSSVDFHLWEKWSAKGSKFFINKSIQEHYSPGSVFKPFVALAALEENLITKETLIPSGKTFRLGNRTYHDHNPLGHGDINVTTAIEKSANTFFYPVAHQLGIKKITYYADLFGFGKKTQIDFPWEKSGLFPNPKWKEKSFHEKWQKGDTLNLSIGQGSLLSTLLQLTVAYNIIATEGLVVKPFLVLKKYKERVPPVTLDSLTDRIKRQHFKTIKEGLKKVVEGSQGTARWYKLPSLSFSGKTGTTQVISLSRQELYQDCKKFPEKYRHHGWFLSFAPSDKPEIIVSVFTEHSCSGSSGSAPIARDIIQYYFKRKLNQ